jgi:diguanylate cyclase (GGDEF)-like protein
MTYDNQTPTETIEFLKASKRRIYQGTLAAGLFAVLSGWLFKSTTGTITPYDTLIFPFMTCLCLSLQLLLWRVPRAIAWVELSLLAGTSISLLGSLVDILLEPESASSPNHLAAFADLLYWFPLVYVLAFLIFENRRLLLACSLAFFAAAVTIGFIHGVMEWRVNGEMEDIYLLGRFYLANIIYIVLLMVSVRLNEHYVRLRTLAETMTQLAHTDALMRIANRRELDTTLTRELKRSTRHNQPLSVIMIDIDHFKQVNDTHGHEIGDAVLKETAEVAQSSLRLSDLLGRWGGEEFMVVAPQTNAAQAHELAERLRLALAGHSFEHIGHLTASFGVAEYRPQEAPEAWLKRADRALYAAKQAGRNRVEMEKKESA